MTRRAGQVLGLALCLGCLAHAGCDSRDRARSDAPGEATAVVLPATEVPGAADGAVPVPPPVAAAVDSVRAAPDGGDDAAPAPDAAPATPEPVPAPAPDAVPAPTPAAEEGPACVPVDVTSAATADALTVVLCRDAESATAYASGESEGRPTPTAPPAGLADPFPKHDDGLATYQRMRQQAAPRAKFTPNLFFTEPCFSQEQWALFAARPNTWQEAKAYWSQPTRQNDAFRTLYKRLQRDKATLRAIVLRGGYLYTEDPKLARRFYKSVRLDGLFDDDEIFLQRGDDIHRLRRNRTRGYVHADGPLAGRKAGVLLFDRLATSRAAFAQSYHWDLQSVRRGLGLLRMQVTEANVDALPFTSTFLSGDPVAGVLFRKHNRTAVAVHGLAREQFAALVQDNAARFRAKDAVLDAAAMFVDEWIRFDEPDIEFGQEDGKLREAWEVAYRRNEDHYSYNGVRYRVFGGGGIPIPPQVCIDFLMDAVERASGTWWGKRGEPRQRVLGTVDWRAFDGLRARSVQSLITFAKRNPDIFEVFTVPKSKEVQFRDGTAFYRNLERFPVTFREGDIVVIWGYREDQKRHFHSFYVHAVDPIDGFPIILSDNAGLAAHRVWYDIMKTAPRRYVHQILRLRDDWLIAHGIGQPRPPQ